MERNYLDDPEIPLEIARMLRSIAAEVREAGEGEVKMTWALADTIAEMLEQAYGTGG